MLKASRDSIFLFKPFIISNITLLLCLFATIEFFQNYFMMILQATRETQSMNLPAMLGQLLTSLLEFVALTMLVPLRVMEMESGASTPQSFMKFTQKHIGALTAESLRALAVTIMWTVLFILPGLFKYIRLSFVPYIVVADPDYEKGHVDALQRSNELVKGYTMHLFLLFIFLFLLESGRAWIREKYPIMQAAPITIIGTFTFYMINIYANILLFRIYQLRVKAVPHTKQETLNAT